MFRLARLCEGVPAIEMMKSSHGNTSLRHSKIIQLYASPVQWTWRIGLLSEMMKKTEKIPINHL